MSSQERVRVVKVNQAGGGSPSVKVRGNLKILQKPDHNLRNLHGTQTDLNRINPLKIRPPSTTRKTQGEDQSKDLLESPASKLDRVHKEIKEIEHKLAKKKSKVVKTKPVMESSSAAGPSETTSNNLESIKPLKSKNKTEISANQEIRQTSIYTSDNQSSVTTKDFETSSNSQHNNQNITEETQTPGVSTEKDSTLNKNMSDPFQVDAKVEPEKEKEIIQEEKLEDQESTKSGEIAQITGKIVESARSLRKMMSPPRWL